MLHRDRDDGFQIVWKLLVCAMGDTTVEPECLLQSARNLDPAPTSCPQLLGGAARWHANEPVFEGRTSPRGEESPPSPRREQAHAPCPASHAMTLQHVCPGGQPTIRLTTHHPRCPPASSDPGRGCPSFVFLFSGGAGLSQRATAPQVNAEALIVLSPRSSLFCPRSPCEESRLKMICRNTGL